ncbi:unnamed protein product [Mytilus edulis]|uniref:Uncharacterized protein n=1 Tax=Mytilus edulis TaxID=6550 RepID=A0A8S3SNW7_MYTED|nr:unnamed protein product [Mytilus edulis]
MGKLRNNGFRTLKQVRKLVSIREGQRKRYFEEDHHQDLALKSVHADHSYDVTSKKLVPDISNIVHEEVLDNDGNNLTPTDDWRIGRRVVELGVIADHLQQCKHCGLPLSLHNIIDIKTYGLGSVLKVLCTNKSCGNINAIPTGKQHDHKIWDVNTKSDGNDNVTVSVDAAWQRRGSGRSYDSLTDVDDKVVTKRTANCIARSGLNLSHLRLAYSRNGRTDTIMSYFGDLIHKLKKKTFAKLIFTSILPRPVDHMKTGAKVNKVNTELKRLCKRNNLLYCNLYRSFLLDNIPDSSSFAPRDGPRLSFAGTELFRKKDNQYY